MKASTLALPLLPLMLIACDDPGGVVTNIQRKAGFTDAWVRDAAGDGPLPVSVYGRPILSVGPEDAVAALRMPEGAAEGMDFALAAPGTGGKRMVLHFNPQGDPSPEIDCDPSRAAPETWPAKPTGFKVAVTFCDGTLWMATGFVNVPDGKDARDVGARVLGLTIDMFKAAPVDG